MNKRWLKSLVLMVLSIAFIIGLWLYTLFMPVVYQSKGYVYYLAPGTSKKQALAELSAQGMIRFPKIFSLYIYTHQSAYLKTGEYLFPQGSSPLSIWKQILSGKGLLYRHFTIIPGWSFFQLRQQLSTTEGLHHSSTTLTDAQIISKVDVDMKTLEGEFFPDTYYFTRGISDFVILKRAHTLLQSKLKDAWDHRAENLPYKSSYDALIAASLIEKEAYLNSERPIIAGVLINRLSKDMLLQFDPTVIFGLGTRYDGKIHKTDLTEDTPYNTYVHKGLPPTPIAFPSLHSLQAALHPDKHDYYYFVARKDGSHQFSKTLVEHNAAVQQIETLQKNTLNEKLLRYHIENVILKKLAHLHHAPLTII